MLVRWVNHASFVVEHGAVKLICDPWLAGPAFADGWDLLSKTVFDVSGITHIWYSHEHPDHFVPRVLKEIDEQQRGQITVLYQATRDGKVAKFCKSLGFKTRELRSGEAVTLDKDFTITCGQVPFYDSWLLIEAGGKRILNLNDCVVDNKTTGQKIRRAVGQIDVLMSQFNDAEWKGNPDRRDLREASAREKLQRLRLQAEVFRPAQMIPFASFFYFSHEENFYLNDAMNRIGDVAKFIADECGSQPIVLYPGETWVPGTTHDNEAACRRYDEDLANARPLHRSGESVPLENLVRIADSYRNRIKKNNNALMLWIASNPWTPILPSVTIYLDDLALAVEFDWRRGLRRVSVEKVDANIAMHSESLAFVFRYDWGMDTLTVNGRFRANDAGYRRFVKTFSPGALNNIGRRFGFGLFSDPEFLKRMLSMRRSVSA